MLMLMHHYTHLKLNGKFPQAKCHQRVWAWLGAIKTHWKILTPLELDSKVASTPY